METLEKRIGIARLLTIAMLFNVLLSVYIYIQEQIPQLGAGDACFASGISLASCAKVQSSAFGSLFGIPVSVFGIIAFLFMTIAVWSFAHSLKHGKPIPRIEHESYTDLLHIAFVIGALFALGFIIIQLTFIGAICKYCMFVDSITIVSAVLFIVSFKRN